MKKIKYIFYIILVVTLFLISLINRDNIQNSLVFIESLNNEYLSKGMGFVYKIENNTNYIVTNYHVIHNSEDVYVYNLDNKKIKAEIIDYDIYTDLALLKIEDNLNLKEAKLIKSKVKEKDYIYYFNIYINKIEKGKVLNLHSEIFLDTNYGNSYYDGISIEGNISEGNSGGPVLNKKNEVIGLISLKKENKNTAIYIPIENIIDVVSKLENHSLKRPNLGGIFVSSYNEDILKENNIVIDNINGVVVLEVMRDYPLYNALIIKGDIITRINNINISSVNELQKEIYSCNVGDIINLEYYRNGQLNKVDIVLN